MYERKLTIVVTTSFLYKELIDGFIFFFDRYWPDCPFDVIISLENEVRDDYDKYKFVSSNSSDWSERLFEVLNYVETEYLLLMMDDYFIFDYVDNAEIKFLQNLLDLHNIDHLAQTNNINGYPVRKELVSSHPNISLYMLNPSIKNFNYAIVSADFFRVRFLKSILRKNESAWEFENLGSFRTVFRKNISILKFETEIHPLKYTYGGVIEKGKLRDGVQIILDKLGYNLDWSEKKGLSVSTLDTPKNVRFFRKIVRLIKTIVHLF